TSESDQPRSRSMKTVRRFGPGETLGLGIVFLLALTTRAGYLAVAADSGYGGAPIVVQDGTFDLKQFPEFGSPAALSNAVDPSAHIPPGFRWLSELMGRLEAPPDAVMRWFQWGLGALTVFCYFFFVRRGFGGPLAAFLVGFLAAPHPFWIVNTAE